MIVSFSWRLELEAWSLRLEAFEKLFTAAHVRRAQVPAVVYKVIK